MYYTIADTPAGALLLTSGGQKITGMHWRVFRRAPVVANDWQEKPSLFKDVLAQLSEYFDGHRQHFDIAYTLQGTDFQKAVWQELVKIPFGQKRSYQDIATAVDRPKAVRAVGTAVGSNPMSIVVPCHRVLATSGKLGGYAGGLDSKKVLLRTEGITHSS